MASSSRPPPPTNPSHPSPPPSATASTVTTVNNLSTVSPPAAAASTAGSSLSSPQSPPNPHHALPHPASNLSSTLPPTSTPSSERQIAEARQAVLASIGNMLDSSLRDRASVLHSNAAAIAKQERDVAKATEGLRKENDKLVKVANDAAKKVKELGNVQNWAEVLESDFLAIEETIRLVREGSGSERSGSEGSWSGSETGSERGDEEGRAGEGDGDVRMEDEEEVGRRGERRLGKVDKGKAKDTVSTQDDAMDVDEVPEMSGQSEQRMEDSQMENSATDGIDVQVPAVGNVRRDGPSITVPGIEPSQTSTISLEDELRIAMDESIGNVV